MKELTRRQKEVLDIIGEHIRSKGYPPSYREITSILNLASAAGVHKHIKALVKKGALTKENYLSRSLRITKSRGRGIGLAKPEPSAELVELPLIGYVAAGQPIEAISVPNETLSIPPSLLGSPTKDYFILRVRGDSMVEESILDGDYVIVEKRESAKNGEVVVALLYGQEATLKRIFRENGGVRLQPANAKLSPIRLAEEDVQVQGVVIAVWRKY